MRRSCGCHGACSSRRRRALGHSPPPWRLPRDLGEVREKPTIAPDIAVEILSPDDRRPILDEKIDLYVRGGAELVVVVDPQRQLVEIHEGGGHHTFGLAEIARSRTFPDLALDVSELFVDLF